MSNKKIKTSKRKPKLKKQSNGQGLLYGKFKDALSWRQVEPGPAFIDKLLDLMEVFINESPENTCLYQFYRYVGIPSSTFESMRRRNEKLDAGTTMFVEALGAKRQQQAEYKKYGANPDIIKVTLPQYHPTWAQIEKEKKDYQLELIKQRAKESEGSMRELLDYFKDKKTAVPPLKETKRDKHGDDNLSSTD